jgi:hypothetical protein
MATWATKFNSVKLIRQARWDWHARITVGSAAIWHCTDMQIASVKTHCAPLFCFLFFEFNEIAMKKIDSSHHHPDDPPIEYLPQQ